jgi:hypothetical protein
VATTPVNEPPTVSAEEVALGFLDAYAAFDAQKAMTYVADDADLSSLMDVTQQFPSNAKGLSLRLSMLQAVGSELTVTSCEAAPLGSDTSVVCDSFFHALGSDQIGRGPFSNNSFVFTVIDGAIVRAGFGPEPQDKFYRQMWEPFAEWVSSTHPKDAAVMYLDGTLEARFSLESIRLWERHTREYVETRSAETGPAESAPAPALVSAAPDVVRQGTCSDGARWRLEITQVKVGDRLKVRFVLHRSPVGHRWHIHFRYKSHNIFTDYGHVFLRRIRVASGSGVVVVQVSRPGWNRERPVSPDGVDGRAVDWQTGEVCNVSAWYR